ncbi:hypothetical protein, partial [Massilimicrobiota timonensis]|uniref:hypothetical protein n=1 Tax=Massilimicrobiota timonensis TaxID=1776392 RepID=UPI0019615B7D
SGEEFPDIEGIGELNNILKKACHKEPTKRYQSAHEMKEALEELINKTENIKQEEKINTNTNTEKTNNNFQENKIIQDLDEKTQNIFNREEKKKVQNDTKEESVDPEYEQKIVDYVVQKFYEKEG